MKTKVLLLIACLMTTLTGFAITEKTVDGNGNVITKEISISDYNEISTVGVMEFIYEQSDAAPYLKVTIDENLFPLLKINVEGKELKVGPKRINESSRNGNTYNLNPTTFKVVTNSREIKELNVVSSGDFIIASPINISKLEINMAGSGNILLKKKVEGNKLEVNLASSGSVVASDIDLRGVECSLAGSGFIQIGGKAEQAEYNLAASGSIKAYDCTTGKVEGLCQRPSGSQYRRKRKRILQRGSDYQQKYYRFRQTEKSKLNIKLKRKKQYESNCISIHRINDTGTDFVSCKRSERER